MPKDKKAVIVIDMLEDFVFGSLANKRAEAIISPLKKLLAYARKKHWLVVYVNDAHLPGDPEEKVWGVHALAGTPGAQVIKTLKPQKGDVILPKRTYSSFYETGLDLLLRQNGVTTIIITGQHTHICVRHTSADAFARNYDIIIPRDCVESFTQEDHEKGLEYLKMCYKAKIVRAKDLTK
ncbi:MAG: nicotinamidase [Candidatus Tagabacteria bacterium CG10_big_fil_rev_8_21_14_0_10_40_13]|uniref:Nicotinamidase n=1 Tax=Candidatus Tagabacteria bacterium CG10_big_fil_rev_8_21_14_0_10_40_13 TaxID=1975022 RepID=A0A2M8L9J2_9BACT|nr:MAG: nicotinamidase [Candidatus Tagabacteria bacterium CG10_big_fil_rev_8_21_14_0_10_40_13]